MLAIGEIHVVLLHQMFVCLYFYYPLLNVGKKSFWKFLELLRLEERKNNFFDWTNGRTSLTVYSRTVGGVS